VGEAFGIRAQLPKAAFCRENGSRQPYGIIAIGGNYPKSIDGGLSRFPLKRFSLKILMSR
jgi:hypothetical protein